MSKTWYTLGFDADERKELLEILKDNPKWENRIRQAFNFQMSDIPILNYEYPYFNLKSLPYPLHIGRKVKVVKGDRDVGRIGVVIDHWLNGDHCSGGFGKHLYFLKCDLKDDLKEYGCQNNSYGINVEDCELLDDEN